MVGEFEEWSKAREETGRNHPPLLPSQVEDQLLLTFKAVSPLFSVSNLKIEGEDQKKGTSLSLIGLQSI